MSLSPRQTRQLLSFTETVARRAGEILKKNFANTHRVKYKGRIDPVTEADLRSEKFITSQIRNSYPDHAILAEEGTGRGETAEFRWVIDPLDGTVNYAHGFPIYCVSIGLEHEGSMVLGAVYDPERDEMFRGGRGIGSFMNRTRLHVSRETSVERALLATGFGYNIATARRNNLGLFARMAKKVQGLRRPGSAAMDMCWTAAGRVDGFWELYLHPWDTGAALVIIEEAGGKVTQVDGSPYSIFDNSLLTANPGLHTKLLRLLSGK